MILNKRPTPHQCPVLGGAITYKIVNEYAAGLPIIVVHGGPGTPHDYLLSLSSLLPTHPIIFYDQLNCGMSAGVNEPQWWKIERFANEIEQLSQHLNLEKFNLYAHSAGTMIAFDYSQANPDKINKLVLASPVLSVSSYLAAMNELLGIFPETIRTAFETAIQFNKTNTIEYMEATAYFAEHHLCRLPIWPDELFESSVKTNIALRNHMWGCSDFLITGVLKNYERESLLPQFKVKTLITVGEYDFISSDVCNRYTRIMNDAKLAIIPDASHNPHLEQPQHYAEVLQGWFTN